MKINPKPIMHTEYIADLLHGIRTTKIPVKAPKFRASGLSAIAGEVRDRAADLDGRELYAFDLSALNAAADLRIDTPDRVDRLVTAVLETPRRLFIEAKAADMSVINRNLRGLLSPWGAISDPRVRWGAYVDVHGEGCASYQSLTLVPAEPLKSDPDFMALREEARTFEGDLYAMVSQSLRMRLAPIVGDIDITRHVGMSRKEFDTAFSRISTSSDLIAQHAKSLLEQNPGVRRSGQIMDEAWRAMRFRDILRTQPASGRDAKVRADGSEGLEALRVGLPIIAMLAVLSADASDLRAEPREKKSRAPSKAAKGQKKAPLAPGLKVVTLNLEDRELQQIYNSHDSGFGSGADTEGDSHSGRVRHPVRGHLFLARNRKMTWRKPHWRGTLERPVLRRVTAPSHLG